MREFVFYHADRAGTLAMGMELGLNPLGYSLFGATYAGAIAHGDITRMSADERREYLLEVVRQQPPFNGQLTSRLQCLFAANTVDEAMKFAATIEPTPVVPVGIFEVFATSFRICDQNFLDYVVPDHIFREYCKQYWFSEISHHTPTTGERKLPMLEVLLPLPVRIGQRVASYSVAM